MDESLDLLRRMLGPTAQFREGQQEAIAALVNDRARLLLVQKTGWGKSFVYFIATRMLRDRGAGPTFLVSPLLSLMRNQEAMATKIGVRARRLDSSNREDWNIVQAELRAGEVDLLMVSPERLANQEFRTRVLPVIQQGVGMVVVDEAHCISDWGHDFRPDYRRIVQVVRMLPSTIPVLATTATANDRVVADVQRQIGAGLQVRRGPLARATLRLQTIHLGSQADRLAWLAEQIPLLPGTGIIYCLTVRDTELVAGWLRHRGIDAAAYHADIDSDDRIHLEKRLISNDIKALVATVALGMGFDKPDLGFVVHYQRPGSVIAYYQQIGRAGRAGQDAYAILLSGREDDEIQEYFINQAFPPAERLLEVAAVLAGSDGMTAGELEGRVNIAHNKLEQCLKFLEVEGAIVREGSVYQRTPVAWQPDVERSRQVTARRYEELAAMQEFVDTGDCLMEFVARRLDDPAAAPCGRCANCAGDLVSRLLDEELVDAAAAYLGRTWIRFAPRRQLAAGVLPDRQLRIELDLLNETGLALCAYGDSGWGDLIRRNKYEDSAFDNKLVIAAREAILATWEIDSATWWVTAIPSLRHPGLVGGFAARLAKSLELPYHAALIKKQDTAEQKQMQNSFQQLSNLLHAFHVEQAGVQAGPVILIDDIVDSRWTFTMAGALLKRAGSGPVHPFALAAQRGAQG